MFDEFLSKVAALSAAECPFAVAVVVRYQTPVSGKQGTKRLSNLMAASGAGSAADVCNRW
jgi:hypothetical protein